MRKARDLIENGLADVNAISKGGDIQDCLIHTAARDGNHEMVGLLVEHGCDVNAKNNYGLTPLHLGVASTHDKENKALHELLKAENINFDEKDKDGVAPYIRAIALGNTSAFQTLTTAISKKTMEEKKEKEWQQKWNGTYEGNVAETKFKGKWENFEGDYKPSTRDPFSNKSIAAAKMAFKTTPSQESTKEETEKVAKKTVVKSKVSTKVINEASITSKDLNQWKLKKMMRFHYLEIHQDQMPL